MLWSVRTLAVGEAIVTTARYVGGEIRGKGKESERREEGGRRRVREEEGSRRKDGGRCERRRGQVK